MEAVVFLDSAYAIALAAPTDQLHEIASALAKQLKAERTRLVTTRAVLLEIGNALSKRRYRLAAVTLLSAVQADPSIEIVELSKDLYDQAFQLFQSRTDKDWGLIDCASFVVMTHNGITEALTPDEHFEQAGFRALLRPT